MKQSFPFVLVLSVVSFVFAQQHQQEKPDEPFQRRQLTDSIHALVSTEGSNIGFMIGPDAVVVVDSHYRKFGPNVIAQIKSVTDKPIKYLINTHHHGDHTGGNEHFLSFSLIFAHDNARKHMFEIPARVLAEFPARIEKAKQEGDQEAVRYFQDQIEWAKKVKVEEIAAPFLTFDSEFRIHTGTETIQLWHTPPAHTDGDVIVYFEKANVVHMGDVLFNKKIPYIDVKAGGSPRGYLTALDKVLARIPADCKVIPGHGEITDINGIKNFRRYIQDLNDYARQAKQQGKSKEDFVKEADLPAYKEWDGYKDRFKLNAEAAFGEADK